MAAYRELDDVSRDAGRVSSDDGRVSSDGGGCLVTMGGCPVMLSSDGRGGCPVVGGAGDCAPPSLPYPPPYPSGLSHGHTHRAQGSYSAVEHGSSEHQTTKSVAVSGHPPRIWLHQIHEVVPFRSVATSWRRL